MSAAFAETVLDRPTADVRELRRSPAPTRTAPRRRGPGVGPGAHPRRLRFTAPAVRGTSSGPRACTPAPTTAPAARVWRLTDRGLTVVLVVAAALVAASIAVVGLTALRVTSDTYRPTHVATAPVLVQP